MSKNFIYKTLFGEELSLSNLTEVEIGLLKDIYFLYKNNVPYPELFTTANNPESLRKMGAELFQGKYYIDKKLSESVIYKVLEDLTDRAGIREQFLGKDKKSNTDFSENKKTLEDFFL